LTVSAICVVWLIAVPPWAVAVIVTVLVWGAGFVGDPPLLGAAVPLAHPVMAPTENVIKATTAPTRSIFESALRRFAENRPMKGKMRQKVVVSATRFSRLADSVVVLMVTAMVDVPFD
jgi:hypothetical protein